MIYQFARVHNYVSGMRCLLRLLLRHGNELHWTHTDMVTQNCSSFCIGFQQNSGKRERCCTCCAEETSVVHHGKVNTMMEAWTFQTCTQSCPVPDSCKCNVGAVAEASGASKATFINVLCRMIIYDQNVQHVIWGALYCVVFIFCRSKFSQIAVFRWRKPNMPCPLLMCFRLGRHMHVV